MNIHLSYGGFFMQKAILFDLDGTLLDRDSSLISFIDHQYERLYNSLGHINKKQYIDRFIKLDNKGYTWKDVVYETLVAEFHIDGISPQELLQDYLEYFPHHCIAFPHVIEMLETLKGRQVKLGRGKRRCYFN
jgi:putative hydrolase of the HAD superfamily